MKIGVVYSLRLESIHVITEQPIKATVINRTLLLKIDYSKQDIDPSLCGRFKMIG
jgi:hypothetical protein